MSTRCPSVLFYRCQTTCTYRLLNGLVFVSGAIWSFMYWQFIQIKYILMPVWLNKWKCRWYLGNCIKSFYGTVNKLIFQFFIFMYLRPLSYSCPEHLQTIWLITCTVGRTPWLRNQDTVNTSSYLVLTYLLTHFLPSYYLLHNSLLNYFLTYFLLISLLISYLLLTSLLI